MGIKINLKLIWALFILIILSCRVFAQKVDSIKVEQAGDFLKIRYKILNSTSDQIFRVRVLCSINGGLNTELRSITGDVGDNVPGGKEEYWVVWDVLKDVDELKSAEFIVRAELVTKPVPIPISPERVKRGEPGNFSIMGVFFVPGPGFGARISYMGKAGISAVVERGKAPIMTGYENRTSVKQFARVSLDFTTRIVNSKSLQMHLLIGAGAGQALIDDVDSYPVHFSPCVETGTAFYIKRLALFATVSKLLVNLTEEGSPASRNAYFSIGAGFRF